MSSTNKDEIFPVDDQDTDVMVTLELDGEDLDCEIITIITVNDQDYIVLMPVDEHGEPLDDTMVYIYRYYEDATTGEPYLDNISSDEEYDAVNTAFNAWQDLNKTED